MAVQLGKKYKDRISEFVGTATGVHNFLNGCQRVTLSGAKDGKPEDFTFDVQQLEDEFGKAADDDYEAEATKQVSRLNRVLGRNEQAAPEVKAEPKRKGGPRPTPGQR